MQLSGLLAEVARATGKDGRSLAQRALVLARELGDEVAVRRNRIRFATSLFYLGQHDEAEEILRSTIQEIEASENSEFLDFAYQHLGKCVAEQSRFDEAAVFFEAALGMRVGPLLRQSSRPAIELARAAHGE